ncbi:MAG: 3-hydroxyacyl-CoA dehydrogenase NAD-binding domain-containing protein [Pseudomonadota bacterium]
MSVGADGVAVLTIDLPEASMNVVNEAFSAEFAAFVERVLTDDAVKGGVVISGKKDFMAGADLRMLERASATLTSAEEMFNSFNKLNKLLRRMETGGAEARAMAKGQAFAKPIVAAVGGMCLGGGFEVALGAHIRIAAPDAVFGLPEVKVGLLPGGGGTQRLPRMVGIQTALQHLTTGSNIKAEQAQKLGIVSEIVPREDLLERAKALVLEHPKILQPWDKKGFKVPGGAGGMHPNAVQTFIGANAMAHKETRGNYPAVQAILSCVYEGAALPIDKAVMVESKYFTKLMLDPSSTGMIRTLFKNKLAAEKGARRPAEVPRQEIKKIGMLGAGLMGAGIAYEAARAGMEVVLLDMSQEGAEKGVAYSKRLLDKAVGRGKLSQEKADAHLARLHATTNYEDLKGADFIIEAVFESEDIKRDVTTKAEAVVGPDVIFGSNTSTLPITGLQKNWSKPENFIGVHFFSPVEKMPLVEMIMGEQTGDRALAVALDFTRAIKKTPIVVNDGRGFYTSRCVGAFIGEGSELLAEGVAPALIENMGKNAGYPMGPLLLADSTNIDLGVKIVRAYKEALGDNYEAGAWEQVALKMSDELQRHGMKIGKGFYDYDDGAKKPSRLWPGLGDHFPRAQQQPEPQEVADRILYRQMVECVNAMAEGVLTTPEDGDIGAIFGWGFPPFTGGPFSHIDAIGAKAFVERCDALAGRYGARFTPPEFIRKMAAEGRSFYGAEAAAAA